MTDNSLKVSELPTTTNVASTDRVMILYNASNTSVNASVRTITVSNYTKSTVKGPYANDSVATTAGVGIGSMYYDASGIVHVRLS